MTLEINSELRNEIAEHGERTYPRECCGALLGVFDAEGNKTVRELLPLDNRREGESARRRFLVSPEDYRLAERTASDGGMEILGFYHSHPDHPARPSDYDREHAWPWYSYIIVSVERGRAGALTNWALAEDRSQFLAEEMREPRDREKAKAVVSRAGIPDL